MKKRQLVEVQWDDVSGSPSWDDASGDYTDLVHCKTAGYLLKSNRKVLVITSTVSEKGHCCDRTSIPRSVVKSIKRY